MSLRFTLVAAAYILALVNFSGVSRASETFNEVQKQIVSFKLDNGLTIILYKRGYAPVISCVTYVKAGSVDEWHGYTGIAHFLEHLAFKGTKKIGVQNPEAEAPLLAEIDGLYERIQGAQKTFPPATQNALQTLLAKLSTGGTDPAQAVDQLFQKYDPENKITKGDRDELKANVVAWATKAQSAEQFVKQNEFSDLVGRAGGVGLNAFTSEDRTVYHVSLPSNRLEYWAALETDRFINFSPRQFEKEKQVVMEERRMRVESNAGGRLYEKFMNTAFTQHFYGQPVIGWKTDILNYTRPQVRKFFYDHYNPGNTIVCVVGDLDIEQAKKTLTEYFNRIPAATAQDKMPRAAEPKQDAERRVEITFPAEPSLMIGFHVPERNHPDTPALTALSLITSRGRTSRLYAGLVKKNTALNAGAWMGPGERYPRMFVLSAEPAEGTTLDQLENALNAEVDRLKKEPPTKEELQRAISQNRVDVLNGLKSNLGMAQQLADYHAIAGDWKELFKEIDAIGAVTPEQVQNVANKYFSKENRTVARLVSSNDGDQPTILGVPVAKPEGSK
jgi:predicted Zn-dependent peptidase